MGGGGRKGRAIAEDEKRDEEEEGEMGILRFRRCCIEDEGEGEVGETTRMEETSFVEIACP